MSGRDRAFLILAVLASVLLHAAVVYAVRNLPLTLRPNSTLFERQRQRIIPVRVHRATEDLIVEAGDDRRPSPKDGQPASDAEKLRRDLEQFEIEKLRPPSEAAPEPEEDAESVRPDTESPRPVEAPEPQPGRTLDITRALVALAQPSVRLPRYVGPTDDVTAPPPSDDPIDPAAAIDLAALSDLDTASAPEGRAASERALPAELFDESVAMDRIAAPRNGLADAGAPEDARPAGNIPGADLVARVTPTPVPPQPVTDLLPPPQTQRVVAHLDEDFDYLLRVLPELPREPGLFDFLGLDGKREEAEPGWFEARITPKRSLRRLEPLGKDVVWVIDTSSSITDVWVRQVRRGVSMALETLNEGDRFNIVTFKDTVNVLSAAGPLEATEQNVEAGRAFLAAAAASGYTDVNRALGRLLVRTMPPERVYQIVLITDGRPTRGALDPRQIINLITSENDLVASIFCVGVGHRLDRGLLEFLAYRNKGFVAYPQGVDEVAASIRSLAAELRYPVMKDATFDAAGVDETRIYPRIGRDIYQGRAMSLFGRYQPGRDRLVSIRLTGVNGPEALALTFTLRFDRAEEADRELARRWAFWKLHDLYSRIIQRGETAELRREIDRLRKRYDLKTAY